MKRSWFQLATVVVGDATLRRLRSAASVSDDLRRREGDSLWRVRLGATWLYVQLEFQSIAVIGVCSDTSGMCLRLCIRGTLLPSTEGRRWLLGSSKLPCGIPGTVQGEACARTALGGNRDDDG